MSIGSLMGLPVPHRRQRAVLVLDDDRAIGALVEDALQDAGYRCVS